MIALLLVPFGGTKTCQKHVIGFTFVHYNKFKSFDISSEAPQISNIPLFKIESCEFHETQFWNVQNNVQFFRFHPNMSD